jgi:hypothetical protein
MKATISATTQVAKKNGRNSRNGERPAAFITMISESVASLFSVVRDRDHQRDRRDDQDQRGDHQAGDAEEGAG